MSYYPVFSINSNGIQQLNSDIDYTYNPSTNSLKVSNILDNNNSVGNINNVLMKNNNNLLTWSVPLFPCPNAQYNYNVKCNFNISSKQSQIIGPFPSAAIIFYMQNSFTADNVRPYLYMTPHQSNSQQYSCYLNSTQPINIDVYKVDRSSLRFKEPINLRTIKNISNVISITDETGSLGVESTNISISKNDLIFIVISNNNSTPAYGYIDYNILFM